MNKILLVIGGIYCILIGAISLSKFISGYGISFLPGKYNNKLIKQRGVLNWIISTLIFSYYKSNNSYSKLLLLLVSLLFITTGLLILFLQFNPDFVSIF